MLRIFFPGFKFFPCKYLIFTLGTHLCLQSYPHFCSLLKSARLVDFSIFAGWWILLRCPVKLMFPHRTNISRTLFLTPSWFHLLFSLAPNSTANLLLACNRSRHSSTALPSYCSSVCRLLSTPFLSSADSSEKTRSLYIDRKSLGTRHNVRLGLCKCYLNQGREETWNWKKDFIYAHIDIVLTM